MPFAALIVPIFLAAADAPINVVGHAWAPFISPMGEPFRARTKSDNTLALWFHQADRNGDGVLTGGEMQADADRFFAKLDRDHNGQLEPEEIVAYEWEVAPEIQVNSKQKRSPAEPAEKVVAQDEDSELLSEAARRPSKGRKSGYLDGSLEGGARYSILNLPEPVADADADFNRAVTLAEFRQAAQSRFELLDGAHSGRLSLEQLQALVPPPPKGHRQTKAEARAKDSRIGQPLPRGQE